MDEISLESQQNDIQDEYRYGTVESLIEIFASKNPGVLYVIWVEDNSYDLAHVIHANDSNTLVIARNFEMEPFKDLRFMFCATYVTVGFGEVICKLRCVTVAKLPEKSVVGFKCPDYIGDINKFEDYSQLESQIEKTAEEQGKIVRHIVGKGWMCHLDGKLKNVIFAASR